MCSSGERVHGTRKGRRVEELVGRVSALEAEVAKRERTIRGLHASFSWKVTLPLRMARRARDRVARRIRQAAGKGKGRGARRKTRSTRTGGKRVAPTQGAANDGEPGRIVHRMHELAKEARRRHSEPEPGKTGTTVRAACVRASVRSYRSSRWSGGSNGLGRAYLLAEALRRDFDVEIIASCFEHLGRDVWKPLRACSRVTIRTFEGTDFPRHFGRMEGDRQAGAGRSAVRVQGQASLHGAWAFWPRRHATGRFFSMWTITSWASSRDGMGSPWKRFDALPRSGGFLRPYHEAWTRYCEGLIPLFDGLTVANEVLQARYGGIVLPHLRDERVFVPQCYPRERAREILGFDADDKVVVFAGTPRPHKGVARGCRGAGDPARGAVQVSCWSARLATKSLRSSSRLWTGEQVRAVPDVQFHDPAGLSAGGRPGPVWRRIPITSILITRARRSW